MILQKKSHIEIFGSVDDPEISARVRRLQRYGYVVKVKARQEYASGLGPCGKYLCNCQSVCMKELQKK